MAARSHRSTDPTRDAEEFAALARDLHRQSSVVQTLTLMCTLAVSIVGGADHAGITVVRGSRFETPAASDQVPRQVDTIQYETGEGPCVEAAVRTAQVVEWQDISLEPRWPSFQARIIAETPVRSMLSYKLFLEGDTLGALNLYADKPGAFDGHSRAMGQTFAAHGAIAFRAAQADEQIVNLELGLATSRRIGQAVGILMCRHALNETDAFELLRTASQRSNVKLREIADEVVFVGDLPPA